MILRFSTCSPWLTCWNESWIFRERLILIYICWAIYLGAPPFFFSFFNFFSVKLNTLLRSGYEFLKGRLGSYLIFFFFFFNACIWWVFNINWLKISYWKFSISFVCGQSISGQSQGLFLFSIRLSQFGSYKTISEITCEQVQDTVCLTFWFCIRFTLCWISFKRKKF